MLGIEPGSVMCHASAFLIVLFLQPQDLKFDSPNSDLPLLLFMLLILMYLKSLHTEFDSCLYIVF